MVTLPLDELGIPADGGYEVEDLLTGARYMWSGARNYVELNPARLPGHVLRIERRLTAAPDCGLFYLI